MGNDLGAVRQHIQQILAEAPEGRVLLAQLGDRLRKIPGFSLETYGFRNLKALLQAAAVPGKLVQGGPLEWWLVADGAEMRTPSVSGTDQERAYASGRIRIDSAWWKAVTEFDENRRAWFDLQDEELSLQAALAAAEPERFLEIPRFDLRAQRALARAWSEEQLSPTKDELLAALDAEPTLAGLLRVADRVGLVAKWSERRMEVISTALLQWAKDHGIEPRKFTYTSRALPVERSPRAAPPSSSTGMSLDELRQFILYVVEEMTEPELMQVAVPARFLLRR